LLIANQYSTLKIEPSLPYGSVALINTQVLCAKLIIY